jgi:hypothetical protein
MVEGLCKEVERRMFNIGLKGAKVTLKVKQRKEGAPPPPKFLGHGSCHNLSKSHDTRNGTATRDWKLLYEVAMPMLTEMKVPKEDIRGMGIVLSKLVRDETSSEKGPTDSNRSIVHWFSGKTKENRIVMEETCERRRKVKFSAPEVLTGNECQDEPDDVSACSVVVWSDAKTTRNTAPVLDDYDIALPALSQIHMSQVDVLPSPMKKQIVSKMEAERARNASPRPDRCIAVVARDARFRQTDVKRMFRLAAVKAGERELAGASGSTISLTQLESLPLEVQLQVANDDSRGLGALSPEKRIKNAGSSARLKTDRLSERAQPKRRTSPATVRNAARKNACEAEHNVPGVAPTEALNFFRDNVLPLSLFMDENTKANQEVTCHVVDFLCLCVDENRLSDVVVLLRSIKNRNDLWSSLAFHSIFESVDRKVQECFRVSLDREWVLQL